MYVHIWNESSVVEINSLSFSLSLSLSFLGLPPTARLADDIILCHCTLFTVSPSTPLNCLVSSLISHLFCLLFRSRSPSRVLSRRVAVLKVNLTYLRCRESRELSLYSRVLLRDLNVYVRKLIQRRHFDSFDLEGNIKAARLP